MLRACARWFLDLWPRFLRRIEYEELDGLRAHLIRRAVEEDTAAFRR